LGSCLQNADAGDLEGKVLLIGPLDKVIEDGIAEYLPPPAQVSRFAPDPKVLLDPPVGFLHFGPGIVGTDRSATAHQQCKNHHECNLIPDIHPSFPSYVVTVQCSVFRVQDERTNVVIPEVS
jgi:hypothetical protein